MLSAISKFLVISMLCLGAGRSFAADQAPRVIGEKFVSKAQSGLQLDSPAVWTDPLGLPWVIVSAKGSHQLAVYDGRNGKLVNIVGKKGSQNGDFKRPNGVAVFGDQLFVVERDNRRVQVMNLPDFSVVTTFGSEQLRSPYGIWLNALDKNHARLYITDSFMEGEKYDIVPPLQQLNKRVKEYEFSIKGEQAFSRWTGQFGDTRPQTALHRVESIFGDRKNGKMLIVDEEDLEKKSSIREYTLDGRYTGRFIPNTQIDGQAEGIALLQCRAASYWIVSDQQAPYTIFRVFDSRNLAPVGNFRGKVTANTDGIYLNQKKTGVFRSGVLYAVHNDESLVAFDVRDIVKTLKLPPSCIH